ncbi:MAG: hypothetical protein KDE22_03995 [Rhodobacterales bacterium]|nr:hypothetical protein [Rhodobacterales bacterium]
MTDRQDQASAPIGWRRAYAALRVLAHPVVWLALAALAGVAVWQWHHIAYETFSQPAPVMCVNEVREVETVTGWRMKDTFFKTFLAELETNKVQNVWRDKTSEWEERDGVSHFVGKTINKIWVTRDIIENEEFDRFSLEAARKALAADRATCIITITLEDEKKGVPLEDTMLTCDEMRTVAYWPSRAAKDAYYDVDQACMAKRREREVLPPPAKPK